MSMFCINDSFDSDGIDEFLDEQNSYDKYEEFEHLYKENRDN